MEDPKLTRLKRKRATLKGGITRNKGKAKNIIEQKGSRRVLKNIKVRIESTFEEVLKITQELLAFHEDSEEAKSDVELWLAEVKESVEDIIDEIDEHLESRAQEPESTVSYKLSIDSLESASRLEESEHERLDAVKSPGKVEDENSGKSDAKSLLSSELSVGNYEISDSLDEKSVDAKVAAMKVHQERELFEEENSIKKHETLNEIARLRYRADLLEEQASEESEFKTARNTKELERKARAGETPGTEAGAPLSSENIDSMFRGLRKPELTTFTGEKELYHDWRAQFDIFVDQTNVPAKVKMMMLKNSVSGKALKIIERLGYTPVQYKAALEKLEQKFGGEKRLLQRQLDNILQHPELSEDNLKQLEIFSDHLSDIVAKLEDHGHHNELVGVSTLYTAVQGKIPKSMLVSYQQWINDKERPDGLATFANWLARQVTYRIEAEETKERKGRGPKREAPKRSGSFQSVRTESQACPLCSENHKITDCKRWVEAPVVDRWGIAKRHKLCYRCLKTGHRGSRCRSESRCNIGGCQMTHHFHLHFERSQSSQPHPEPLPQQTETRESHTNSSSAVGAVGKDLNAPGSVLLRTLPVWVSAGGKKRIKINAFLDDGSDTSYIRSEVVTALGIQADDKELTLSTLTDRNVRVKSKFVNIEISGLEEDTKRRIDVWTMEELCSGMSVPDWSRHQQSWEHLKGLQFHKVPGRKTVDILIGADHPELALALEERMGEPGEPVARRTPLGWTCVGRVPEWSRKRTSAHARTFRTQAVPGVFLDEQLRNMWDMDALGERDPEKVILTPEERSAVKKTEESMRRVGDRYEVGIPWKEEVPNLPDNRELARSRLEGLERSLCRRPRIAERYKMAMTANIEKGYIRKVDPVELGAEPAYYLPHFPVIREDKETTKVRIVFDSKAKYEGTCLNDVMLTGPKLQRDI